MRLLHTRTKKLKTFYGEKIPRYAILSHMWGREEDEVLFRHIAGSDADRHEGKRRKGYAKVKGACRKAIEDGWMYIWIDTCCIDKTSSAELSEAINSMYEWYRRSEVCYVYLEDVLSAKELDNDRDGEGSDRDEEDSSDKGDGDEDGGDAVWEQVGANVVWELDSDVDDGNEDDGDEDGGGEDDSDEDDSNKDRKRGMFPIVPFERSRWFKRGWTLQELIAPQFVVFYSKGWVDIGTKASLRDTISAVTRIRVEMLMDYDPQKASVAEKMSWAAFRETTRVEDVAYCLMGLLGVNMPLLYGEGNRAFRRLQEELMKISDDDSLFAWKSRFFGGYEHRLTLDDDGMLADSPWEFRDGMNIVQSKDGAYSPYSMTNQGLQIKLPLLPIDANLKCHLIDTDSENIFKTILKCTIRDTKPARRTVIYLKKIREGHYRRVFLHWLDETETLGETELTSLLVPQASTFTTGYRTFNLSFNIKILPTKSGFTVDGCSLVDGHTKYSSDPCKVIIFKHQDKCFGVAVGSDEGIPWIDFIDVIDQEQSYEDLYEKERSRARLRERHLDRLSEKILRENWWLTVLAKTTETDLNFIIDVQKEPIQAKGWYNPSNDSFSGNSPLKYYGIHSDFKKEGHNWTATSNPKMERKLDVSLEYTLPSKSEVYCIKFSSDGKYLAIGGNVVVQVYDMKTSAEICTLINESTKSEACIQSMCFSPDNKLIATGDSEGCIQIWDIEAKYMHKVLSGHQKAVNYLCFLQNGGDFLISGSQDGTVQFWEIPNWTPTILTFPNSSVGSFAISPNGGLLLAASQIGIFWISDIVTTWQRLEWFQGYKYDVCITFTPDGKGLVGGANETLKYWDLSGLVHTGVKGFINLGASSALAGRDINPPNLNTYEEFDDDIAQASLAVSHDGHWVISKLHDGRLVFSDLTRNSTPWLLVLETAPSSFPSTFATSPAGNMFATNISDDENGIVQVWRYGYIEPQGDPSSHVST